MSKWNKIVDYFNKYKNYPEQTIQKLWEQMFSEIFGYSNLDGEIDSQRNVVIGSKERAIPDIIIRLENKDLFVVELKQANLNCGNEQLFSYLKILKTDIGILICDKIYLYYYDYTKNDKDQIKLEVLFEYDNPDGEKFVELIEKQNFNKEAIKTYIEEKEKSKENILCIKNEINEELIHSLLKKHFSNTYTEEEYKQAIKDINININQNCKYTQVIEPNYPKNDSDGIKLQKNSLLKEKRLDNFCLSKDEIKNLCVNNNLNISSYYTKASKNLNNGLYWANPSISYIYSDWWLILDDKEARQLYCFMIPANSIKQNEIKCRNDKTYLIDIQIYCKNSTFIDNRSKINFTKWLVKTIKY